MDIPIIFEDNNLIVINKPAGYVVNRSVSATGQTIQDWAEAKLKIKNEKLKIKEDFYNRAGIVHRLDKETSGLLLIAKNPGDFDNLQEQFFQRTVTKKYQTLVHGKITACEGEINAPVGRLPWDRRKYGVLPQGREAVTSYKLLELLKSPNGETLSFLEITPHTGRTHQIRIHLKYLGFTIVSDKLYNGEKIYRKDLLFCPRLFLHASSLCFLHPKSKEPLLFNCKLEKDLLGVLDNLHVRVTACS